MASIIQIGSSWRVQVRRKGYPQRTETFPTRILAEKWGRQIEAEIDAGRAGQLAPGHVLLSSLIDRYAEEVGRSKPFGRNKEYTLKVLRNGLGGVPVASLTADRIVSYITKQRGIQGVTASIELTYLGGVLKIARALWRVGVVPQAVEDAREILKYMGLLSKSNERDRRPTHDEIDAIKGWLATRSDALRPQHIDFIIASCFRPPSEIVRLAWADLNEVDKTIVIHDRKDPRKKLGNNQTVPLLNGSFEMIMSQPRNGEFIFPVNGKSWSSIFPRACNDLGIEDLQLYDLRHEAISRLVECGKYSIPEMMLVTGHKDPKQLIRYTQLRARDLLGR